MGRSVGTVFCLVRAFLACGADMSVAADRCICAFPLFHELQMGLVEVLDGFPGQALQ